MYEKPEYSVFGYKKLKNHDFKYEHRMNMDIGRYCESGMAVLNELRFESMCVQISNVMTNLDPKKAINAGPILDKNATISD